MMTCNLEWKNQSSFLIQTLSSLRQNDTLTDCTLAAEGRHIKAHRLILCASSPYLKELLTDHSDKQAIIFLNNVSFSFLQLVVEYIYQGAVNINHTELQKFLQMARALKISGLVNYGEEELPPVHSAASSRLASLKPSSGQKRNLEERSADPATSKGSKMPRRDYGGDGDPLNNRPPIRIRQNRVVPLAPDEFQAACLTLELGEEPSEENSGAVEVENILSMTEDSEGRYQQIEGRRKNSNLIADTLEGYVYRIKSYLNGKQYYRCSHKVKCPGRLVCHEGRFHVLSQHDHNGDVHIVHNYKLVADCRSRVINEDTPVAQIIQEELEKATGVSEVLVTARYLMKTRRLHRQRLKQSDEELAVGILMLSQAETAEDMGVEEDESNGSLDVVPKSLKAEEEEQEKVDGDEEEESASSSNLD